MPRRFPLQLIGILIALGIFVAAMNAVFFHGAIEYSVTSVLRSPAVFLFEKVRVIGVWFDHLKSWRALTQENADLQRQQADLMVRTARLQDLEEENEFLRHAAGLAERISLSMTDAGMFGLVMGADGEHALINKGLQDGIGRGDVIVSGEGVMVGQVIDVSANTSRIRLIRDPGFEITGRVSGGTTTGIVRGNLAQGLTFDLIGQEEAIKEGDTVVSTGTDRFPAALLLGTVAHVEVNDTKLFKVIRIQPAMEDVMTGRVVIIKNH